MERKDGKGKEEGEKKRRNEDVRYFRNERNNTHVNLMKKNKSLGID